MLSLTLTLHELELLQDTLYDAQADARYICIAVGCFDIQHKEIGVFVFLDPAYHPADAVAIFLKAPAGFVAQFVIGIVFEEHGPLYDLVVDAVKRKLVEIQSFYQAELFVGFDLEGIVEPEGIDRRDLLIAIPQGIDPLLHGIPSQLAGYFLKPGRAGDAEGLVHGEVFIAFGTAAVDTIPPDLHAVVDDLAGLQTHQRGNDLESRCGQVGAVAVAFEVIYGDLTGAVV